MHEMAIAQSLLELAEKEAAANGCARLLSLRVEIGALAGVMPEALALCVEALVKGGIHEGLKLELARTPFRLRCPLCGGIRVGENSDALMERCPGCGEILGYVVESGRELILARLEASPGSSVAIPHK